MLQWAIGDIRHTVGSPLRAWDHPRGVAGLDVPPPPPRSTTFSASPYGRARAAVPGGSPTEREVVSDDLEAVRRAMRRDREPYAGQYGDPAAPAPLEGAGTARTSQVPRSFAFC